jgi:hypothetical protein
VDTLRGPTTRSSRSSTTRRPTAAHRRRSHRVPEDYRARWFGEEFGPFLVHTDTTGKVLEAPIALPDVKSPDYRPTSRHRDGRGVQQLGGFEGMISRRAHLYPTLEGPVAGDDPPHGACASSTSAAAATPPAPIYHLDDAGWSVADLYALDDHRFVALERDGTMGRRPCTSRRSRSTCTGPTPPAH